MDIRLSRLSISSWINFESLWLLRNQSILSNQSHFTWKELFVAFCCPVYGESVAIFSNSFVISVICICSLFYFCRSGYRFIKSIDLLKAADFGFIDFSLLFAISLISALYDFLSSVSFGFIFFLF